MTDRLYRPKRMQKNLDYHRRKNMNRGNGMVIPGQTAINVQHVPSTNVSAASTVVQAPGQLNFIVAGGLDKFEELVFRIAAHTDLSPDDVAQRAWDCLKSLAKLKRQKVVEEQAAQEQAEEPII